MKTDWVIKRRDKDDSKIPSFGTYTAVKTWINNNTGVFDNNEVICVINYASLETFFIQMQCTMVAFEL